MKKILFAALLVWANTMAAQTADFSIDVAGTDSMFLVQKRIELATPQNPRPALTVTHSFFRSFEDLSVFVEKIRKEARAESDKAAETLKNAKKLEEAADKIEAAANAVRQPPQQKKQ